MTEPSLWEAGFLANSQHVSGVQRDPGVAALTDGRLVYVWRDWDTSLATIRAQILNTDGTVSGIAFEVNASQNGSGTSDALAVAAGTDGGFAIAWQNNGAGATGSDIYIATYSAAGAQTSYKALFSTAEASNLASQQYQPQIVAQPFGYTVVWTDDNSAVTGAVGINARDFDPNGNAIGAAYHVSDTGGGDLSAAIASYITFTEFDAYVSTNIVWDDNLSRLPNGPDVEGIFANEIGYEPGGLLGFYQASGSTDEGDNAYATPDTAYGGNGILINVWAYEPVVNGGYQIEARMPFGFATTAQFKVNTTTLGSGFQTTEGTASTQQVAVAGSDYGFLVVWCDGGGPAGGNDYDVLGQLIDLNGELDGSEFVISTSAHISIDNLDVVSTPDGRFAVTWSGYPGEIYSQFVDARPLEVVWTGTTANEQYSGTKYSDTLNGAGGDDYLAGSDGLDKLIGGAGHDYLSGGADNDHLEGGLNGDDLRGGSGFDYVSYNASTTGVQVDIGYSNGINGEAQGDTFADIEAVTASNYDDGIWGTDGDNNFYLWWGTDYAFGRGGRDTIAGGGGDDYLFGDAGVDTLNGNIGHDTLRGGDDTDALGGDEGNDIIDGGRGSDWMWGGIGSDAFEFRVVDLSNGGVDRIIDFQDSGPNGADYLKFFAGDINQGQLNFYNQGSSAVVQVVLAGGAGSHYIEVLNATVAQIQDQYYFA